MNLAIVGATGVVGREVIKCLELRNFPITNLYLAASAKSVGKIIKTIWGEIKVREISSKLFEQSDIAFFTAGSEISKLFAPLAKINNCLVIDNSSLFRYDPLVPLVIPEINGAEAFNHSGLIANPNCTTAIAALPLWVLEKNFGIKKIIMSTYQAVSGAGQAGLDELEQQVIEYANHQELVVSKFSHQILFNVIPHIDSFQSNGYTKEEMKVVWETQKIFKRPDLAISCTAVRLPIKRAHSESVVVQTKSKVSPEKFKKLLSQSVGVELVDDVALGQYPTPMTAMNKFSVEIGRIRQSLIFGEYGLEFFISGDQLLRGAALNAVEIAELFIN